MSITYPDRLLPCPICGGKAFVMHDVVDGFEFGWSVGCPVFKLDDGIHGISEDTPTEFRPIIHMMVSREDAIKAWNFRVTHWTPLPEPPKEETDVLP